MEDKKSVEYYQIISEKLNSEIYEKIMDFEDSGKEPITDGIINEEGYSKAKYKILWILKEPYDKNSEGEDGLGGWSLTKDFLGSENVFRQGGRSTRTWYPIIYICYSILNGFKKWNEIPDLPKSQDVRNSLKEFAVINTKKIPGEKTSSVTLITKYFERDKDILMTQIDKINPEIIIFGRTGRIYQSFLGLDDKDFVKMKYGRITKKDKRIYVSAYHPSQWSITSQEEYTPVKVLPHWLIDF